eukprot:TRINITY_DN27525_c0_g1_i1.p1 TRINITY_DN27525_c0_g1~~TRINITY_DN27525_c0_g1_i1.p1  ORF type:complete len:574 (+),score=105.86 TRINITY_DN27525_c0_g1_i1:78-1799(+)
MDGEASEPLLAQRAAIVAQPPEPKPSGKAPTVDDRAPFSRWRCIWDAMEAQDVKRTKPFGRLTVVVDRAFGLLSADVTGYSDAFVILQIDGKTCLVKGTQRTKAITQTLAPNWNETFVLDVYHPRSVLNLTVFDEDFGTQFQGLDLLGLDDDMIGWANIHTEALPVNEWITAWIELNHPDEMTHIPAEKTVAGQLRVEMYFEVCHRDEFFAFLLDKPHQVTLHGPVDFAKLVEHALLLQTRLTRLGEVLFGVATTLLRYPLTILVLTVCVIICTSVVLPLLMFIAPFFVWTLRKEVALNEKDAGQLDRKVDEEEAPSPMSSSAQPPLSTSNSKSAIESEETQEADFEKLKAKRLAKVEKYAHVQHFLPDEAKAELKRAAELAEFAFDTFNMMSAVVKRKGVLTLTFVLAMVVAGLLWYFADYQPFTVQAALIMIALNTIMPYTIFGRVGVGMYERCQRRRRLYLTPQLELQQEITQTQTSEHFRVIQRLSRPEVDYIIGGTAISDATHTLDNASDGHTYLEKSFRAPKWCKTCGHFLWGYDFQGMQCTGCKRHACVSCARASLEAFEKCPARQ